MYLHLIEVLLPFSHRDSIPVSYTRVNKRIQSMLISNHKTNTTGCLRNNAAVALHKPYSHLCRNCLAQGDWRTWSSGDQRRLQWAEAGDKATGVRLKVTKGMEAVVAEMRMRRFILANENALTDYVGLIVCCLQPLYFELKDKADIYSTVEDHTQAFASARIYERIIVTVWGCN